MSKMCAGTPVLGTYISINNKYVNIYTHRIKTIDKEYFQVKKINLNII